MSNTVTFPLRVLETPETDRSSAPFPASVRERAASARASQAAQKLPDALHDVASTTVAAWLEQHARPVVEAYVEERASRPILVGIPRASRLTDLSEATIERLIASGHIPTVRVGARVLIRLTDLERWAEGLPVGGER